MVTSFNLDTMLEKGQKVVIKRSVTFVYEVDLLDYFDEPDFTPVSVEWLVADMEDMTDIQDVLNEYTDIQTESDIVEVFDIR